MSKQKRTNAHGHNSAISYFDSIPFSQILSHISNIVKQENSTKKYFMELDEVIATLKEAGHGVSINGNVKKQFDEQVRKPYLCKLAENMKERFRLLTFISAFSIFNPSEYLLTESELAHYGESELNIE